METFEKKYNEALGWMQKIYPTLTGADKEDAEHYFPELKESADERIRKELYAFISSVQHNHLCANSKREEWLAYLEKKKTAQSDTEKQYVRTLESLISDFLHGKQEVDRDYYQQICNWLEVRHIEQQPAEWNAGDEEYFRNLTMAIDATFGEGNTKNWLQNRFKLLHPQPHWKPSKKQMIALEWKINNTPVGAWQRKELELLYNDLKKL